MQDIGQQREKDDNLTDKTEFLRRARHHQSTFRANYLNLPFDKFGNYLTKSDGEDGKNFYAGFGIFEAVKTYRKYNKPLYSNMLRSEHIPFNLFIPFRSNLNYCKNVLNELTDGSIKSIDEISIYDKRENIKIEFAPSPKEKYLKDGTSFDTYIEYNHIDGTVGIIGIEVKYTEKEYPLIKDSKQYNDIKNKTSEYYKVSDKCNRYKLNSTKYLKTDLYRQIWRNQLLGESMLLTDKDKFKHFTSVTIFPSGNTHFVETSKEYMKLLRVNHNNFIPVTYENFISVARKFCPDEYYEKWLGYIETRYIVK